MEQVSLTLPTPSPPTWAEVMTGHEPPIRTGSIRTGPAAAGVAGTGGVRAESFQTETGVQEEVRG